MNRLLILAVVALATACERPSSSPEGGRSRSASNDSALRATPGYVVDSALPRDEALRRFRVGIDTIPTTMAGAPSQEALIKQFFLALQSRDEKKLLGLGVTKAEFAYLIFPESRISLPPYNQPPDLAWMMIQTGSNTGLRRILDRAGGGQVRYVAHTCPDSVTEGNSRIYRNCMVRVFSSGDYLTRRLFGNIIARDGRYKFLGFDNDY